MIALLGFERVNGDSRFCVSRVVGQ